MLYAIEMLESLNKRHLISPLLLNHESPAVRARALLTVEGASETLRQRWTPGVERLLKDDDAGGPCGGGACAGHRARRSGHRPDAPAPGRPGSAPGGHGRDGAGRQFESRRRRRRRGHARAPVERLAAVGGDRAPGSRPGAGGDRQSALPPAAGAADVRPAARGRARGHQERGPAGRRRLHLRPAAGVAASQPAAEGVGAAGAGRVRRGRHRHARLLPARSRRRHLGPPAHPVDAGADPVAEDHERPGRRAGRRRRLPALQGHQRAAAAEAVAPAVCAAGRARAAAAGPGVEPVLQLPEPALQPGAQGPGRQGEPDRARALREARAHARSPVQAARPALSRGRTSRRPAGRSSTAMRA